MDEQMESTKSQILSTNHGAILYETAEFFIVQWSLEKYDEYQIITAIEYSNGKRSQMRRMIQESDVEIYINNPEKANKIVEELKIGTSKIILDQMKDSIVANEGITLIYEDVSYLIIREHHNEKEVYDLVAPANGTSGMENNYPWSYEITKEQVDEFCIDHEAAHKHYYNVRYGKQGNL